jgi:putative photosynthetic complex assembly protein 2
VVDAPVAVVVVVVVVAVVVLAWWGFTIAVMGAARGHAHATRIALGTVCGLVASLGLATVSAHRHDTVGDVLGFLAALVAWACVELLFLTGLVVGPRRTPCPPVQGARRFLAATEAVIHHELVLVAVLVSLVACTHDDNRTAVFTFGALWVLRVSTKLHLFWGVPVSHAELLPTRVAYLASYFGPRRSGVALWCTVAVWTVVVVGWVVAALARGPRVADGLVCTLAALGVLEHVFMAVDVGDARLWALATDGAPAATGPVRDGHSSPV